MNLVVWHASGPDFDVDAFLEEFPRVASEAESWHRGDLRALGRVCKDSGFSIRIEDASTFPAALEAVRQFFGTRRHVLEALHSRGASSVIDIGVDVGTRERFVACLHVSASNLQWLAQLGAALEISAYPTSDDEEDAGGH